MRAQPNEQRTTGVVLKRCSRCNNFKSTANFWRSRERPDGLQFYCKQCLTAWKVGPENNADQRRRRRLRPEKKRAWGAVYYAISVGRLVRPTSCERCGHVGGINGHHEDYSKPLDVEWLCMSCHRLLHAAEKEQVA